MKTYAKFLNRAAMLASVLVFCSASAKAAVNSVSPTNSAETFILSENSAMPPSNLQIVNLSPFMFNGGVHIRCNGTSTGRVMCEVSGGVPPYNYSWSSGVPVFGGEMAVGLSAGPVSVTVTDAVGNSVSQSVTLVENPPLQAIANVDPILCNGGVATIVMNASGGTQPYNGLNWYQFPSGTYEFTVADANGCRDMVTLDLIEPPVLQATSVVTSPILCNGDAASVTVDASGGVGPYNGLGVYDEYAGTSSYVVTDANGCYAYTSVSISQPGPLTAVVSSSEIECRGDLAHITVEGNGGVSPYMGIGSFSAFQGNLTYTITDANGCQASSSIQVSQPPALVANISNTPIACNGDLSAVQVTATGGVAPYTGPGTFYEPAGTHIYTVEDANGCSVDITTHIVQPREIEVDVSWGPLVNNTTDVVVQANGGTPAYVGTGVYPESPGTYTYTVYDANGCSGTEVITISNAVSNPVNSDVVIFEQNNDMKDGNINVSHVQGSFNADSKQMEITYELKYDSKVSIEVYDLKGALVESVSIDEGAQNAGMNRVTVDTDNLTSGVYLYHFITNSERHVGKLRFVE